MSAPTTPRACIEAALLPDVPAWTNAADAILAALADAGFAVRSDAEVAAQVAAAVMAEREACAKRLDNRAIAYDFMRTNTAAIMANEARDGARSILARPALAGADALAAMLAQARREALEEAADVCDELHEHTPGVCAAAIRALLPAPDAALAQDFTRWTEGESNA